MSEWVVLAKHAYVLAELRRSMGVEFSNTSSTLQSAGAGDSVT